MARGRCVLPALLVFAIGLPACAAAQSGRSSPTPAAPLSATDSFLIEMASHAAAASPRVAELWPGFWDVRQPFALWPYRDGALVVVSPGTVPDRALPIGESLPPALHGRAVYWPDSSRLEEVHPFVWEYPVGRLRVPGVGLLEGAPQRPRDLQQLYFLFHESFHAYQSRAFASRDGIRWDDAPIIDPTIVGDPDFRAYMGVERRLLADALLLNDPDSVRALGQAYLAVRSHRLGALPELLVDEQWLERNEGAADLVSWHAALLAVGAPVSELPALLRENLLFSNLEENRDIRGKYRLQLYATGAAIGVLLDRLKPNGDWRQSMEEGATFPELLAHTLGRAWPDTLPAGPVVAAYGFAELRARFAAAPDLIGAFRAYEGPRVVVTGVRGPSDIVRGETVRVTALERIVSGDATIEVTADGVDLRSEGRLVGVTAGPRFSYEIHVDELPRIDGAPSVEGTTRRPSLRIEQDGLTIGIARPVTVTRSGSTLTIDVE